MPRRDPDGSSASRRKGATPKRRPPAPTEPASTSPAARLSGPSGEEDGEEGKCGLTHAFSILTLKQTFCLAMYVTTS